MKQSYRRCKGRSRQWPRSGPRSRLFRGASRVFSRPSPLTQRRRRLPRQPPERAPSSWTSGPTDTAMSFPRGRKRRLSPPPLPPPLPSLPSPPSPTGAWPLRPTTRASPQTPKNSNSPPHSSGTISSPPWWARRWRSTLTPSPLSRKRRCCCSSARPPTRRSEPSTPAYRDASRRGRTPLTSSRGPSPA